MLLAKSVLLGSLHAYGVKTRKKPNLKVSLFGLSCVGAVSAACVASQGHEVIGVDSIPQQGRPDQQRAFAHCRSRSQRDYCIGGQAGRLRATDKSHAVRETELAFVCIDSQGGLLEA